MVRRRVGVFERDAVEGKCVLAVGKTAEERLTLSKADSVRIGAESARRLLNHLGEIRDRGHEVCNHGTADLRFGGSRIQRITERSCVRSQRYRFLNRDGLRNGVHVQGEGDLLRSARGDRHSKTRIPRKAGRSHLNGIDSRGKTAYREATVRVGGRRAANRTALTFHCYAGALYGLANLIQNGTGHLSFAVLRPQGHHPGAANERTGNRGTRLSA